MTRNLNYKETSFVKGLLNGVVEWGKYIQQLSSAKVVDLNVKYCLRFLLEDYDYKDIELFGSNLVQRQVMDNDNVPILISLDFDRNGNLYELDVCKADFSEISLDLLTTKVVDVKNKE